MADYLNLFSSVFIWICFCWHEWCLGNCNFILSDVFHLLNFIGKENLFSCLALNFQMPGIEYMWKLLDVSYVLVHYLFLNLSDNIFDAKEKWNAAHLFKPSFWVNICLSVFSHTAFFKMPECFSSMAFYHVNFGPYD